MIEIIPAVLAKNYKELQEKISQFVNYTRTIQIDICDGKFVPSYSWPFDKLRASQEDSSIEKILNEEEGMPYWDKLDFEFDLMVANASQKFDFFVRLGAKRIIFHVEAEADEKRFKEFLEGLDNYTRDNIEIGLAINTTTPIEQLEPYINYIDFVQCMGITNIGFQGEPFDEKVLGQIKDLRLKYPELKISVDGGVNDVTAPLLVKSGADRLVVGSYLLKSFDVKETIRDLGSL